MPEAAEVKLYENTERFVGNATISRRDDRLVVTGRRERRGPRWVTLLFAAVIGGGLIVAVVLGRDSEVGAAAGTVAALAFWLAVLFRDPTEKAELSFPIDLVRLVETDPWMPETNRAGEIRPDPYRLAFEVMDGTGRDVRFDFHAEGAEAVASLLEMLAA